MARTASSRRHLEANQAGYFGWAYRKLSAADDPRKALGIAVMAAQR